MYDKKDPTSRALSHFPLEIWYWMSIKKLEIGFELDLWPTQLTQHVYFWMHILYSQWDKNRTATYKGFSFTATDEDSMIINKMLLDQCDASTKKRILQGYHMGAKITYLRSLSTVFHWLFQNNLLKKMMTDVEVHYAYDARLTLNQDVFFLKSYTFQECQQEMEEPLKENASTGLMGVKAQLFEASKVLGLAVKYLGLSEAENATLAGMSKVGS